MLMTNPPGNDTELQSNLLHTINDPADLRKLSPEQLSGLAAELRETIIQTTSETGGHLAPSLGVVELTIALHYVFKTPQDKLIWDVGHQSYAHKLLTGRRDTFHTLRQHKGISGFPKRSESVHDAVETGHSSTSISYGLGMAAAKCCQNSADKVVAIIGDGSMTAGMAFEGLNNAGDLDKDLIVILNDNEMSISRNVGAFSSFMNKKLTGKTVRRLRDHIEERLLALSSVGENILTVLRKGEESLKGFFTPGMLFEALKFKYVGPIHGHDLPTLLETLKNVREHSHGPVLVHVLTTKGKGYSPAEKNPGAFHGVGPFDRATGKSKPAPEKEPFTTPTPPSYTSVFGQTLCSLAEKDRRIIGITAAMASGTGMVSFSEKFPHRFYDVGIAEQHAVTFAAGLAMEGMRPVVAIYSTFMQRALDQILHDVCLPNLPVTFALDRSGVVGADGPTHHGVFDASFLRFIPQLTLMAPKDEGELQQMLLTAVNGQGPCAIRYPRGAGEGVSLAEQSEHIQPLAIGRGELLGEGTDILLLPIGNRVGPALRAADKVRNEQGLSVAVINPRFIKPLDEELICDWASQTRHIITVEDHALAGGFGSAILELLMSRGIHKPVTCLGYPDKFVEHAPQAILWQQAGIDAAGIAKAIQTTKQ